MDTAVVRRGFKLSEQIEALEKEQGFSLVYSYKTGLVQCLQRKSV